jgi:hypothetical protein
MEAPIPPPKPDFTGVWRFNKDRSQLEIPAPEFSRFEIEHQDPVFRLTRTLVYGAQSNTFSIELTADGKPSTRRIGDIEAVVRLTWDGADLLFDSVLRKSEEEGSNLVRYSLQNGGRTIVATESFRSRQQNYDNVWVLDRVDS